jgi:hypothetical protein
VAALGLKPKKTAGGKSKAKASAPKKPATKTARKK